VRFYHAAMGSPATSTFQGALDKGFFKLPGLTSAMARRNPPNPTATAKGHLDQSRRNQRSTQHTAIDSDTLDPDDTTPPPHAPHGTIVTQVIPAYEPTARNHTDLTGRFPVASKRGHQYIMLMYAEDSNYIHVEPMRNRNGAEYLQAYRAGHQFFESHGAQAPRFERFDNEVSAQVKAFCQRAGTHVQLAPPGMHRTNRAERAIRTFKNHFIATLASLDPSFPLTAWDELLPQAELSLNLLRASRLDPSVSAYQQLHGAYDFNSTPIAPPGTPIVTHVKPHERPSWAPHGEEGFYVGPAMEHYRCYKVLVTRTQTTRITDTLSWHPRHEPFPGALPSHHLTLAIQNLTQTLADHPHHHLHDPDLAALGDTLRHLADLFTPPPPAPRSEGVPRTIQPAVPLRLSEGAQLALALAPPPDGPPPGPPAPPPTPPPLFHLELPAAPPDPWPDTPSTPLPAAPPTPQPHSQGEPW